MNFETNKCYTNRYGKRYEFKNLGGKILFEIEDFGYGRVGGLEGQETLDMSDLGMFDPASGPYVCLGMEIDGKEIVKISSVEEGFLLEVKDNKSNKQTELKMKRYELDDYSSIYSDPEGDMVLYSDVEPFLEFVKYIANDYVESSYDKVRAQRDDYIKMAKKLLRGE